MSKSPLISFTDALNTIQANSKCLVSNQTIELNQALGKVLAQDIIAELDIPPASNSAMDGYVMRLEDWQANKVFTISQRIPAGQAATELAPGTVARIFTGAEIPTNADLVIMQENATQQDEGVSFQQTPKQHDNIRPQGQDITKGDLVLSKGTRLEAQHLGMIASLGIKQVNVFSKLSVGVLTTGDELVEPGTPLAQGQIYNSNGPMLKALVEKLGYQVTSYQHAPDNHEETEAILAKMAPECDIILSSGGVSVGEEDHVKNVIQANGELLLWKIAIKPGKPLVHGKVFDTPFIGLPGNPSSTLVTFHWFATIALAVSSGLTVNPVQGFEIASGFSRQNVISRDEFLRVSIVNGKAVAHSQQSSGALSAACHSHGYFHIPAGEKIEENKRFIFYPFSSF